MMAWLSALKCSLVEMNECGDGVVYVDGPGPSSSENSSFSVCTLSCIIFIVIVTLFAIAFIFAGYLVSSGKFPNVTGGSSGKPPQT